MVDKLLGRRLYDAGWNQGTLLPVLPWSVIYNPNEPLTRIAKLAEQQNTRENRRKSESISTIVATPPYRIASGPTREKDYLVIISQDCEIIKDPNMIPTIFAMRAFTTDNNTILKPAVGNSTQHFLLDENQGLVADSTIIVPIEKPVLLNFTPQPGILYDNIKYQFARWIAHCFNRPAFPDEVVEAVVAPILDNIREMQEKGDYVLDALAMVKEVRIAPVLGNPPYDVSVLFIVLRRVFQIREKP